MYLYKTTISGMMELGGVGYAASQDSYDKAMTPIALKGCNVVAASLTVDQKDGISCLLKNGFIQTGKPKKNPNSGHMIVLLIKFIR